MVTHSSSAQRTTDQVVATLPPALPTSAWLKLDQVLLFFPFSRAQLYRLIAAGQFPKPKKIGRLSVWHSRELRALLDRGPRAAPARRRRTS